MSEHPLSSWAPLPQLGAGALLAVAADRVAKGSTRHKLGLTTAPVGFALGVFGLDVIMNGTQWLTADTQEERKRGGHALIVDATLGTMGLGLAGFSSVMFPAKTSAPLRNAGIAASLAAAIALPLVSAVARGGFTDVALTDSLPILNQIPGLNNGREFV